MKRLLLTLAGCLIITYSIANEIYDKIPITPQTWEEVDLSYTTTINDKSYTEQANLLRPVSWVKQNHLDKIGAIVHLSKEQLGIDVDAKVIGIKPTKLNYSNNNHENIKPVIATFVTHSNDVWDYTFKDQYGNKEVIQAVSGHAFYSADRKQYIPIKQFKIGEHVKSNSSTTLLSRHKHNRGVEVVSNFEVYQQHDYKAGASGMVVHNNNPCEPSDTLETRFKQYWLKYWFGDYTTHEVELDVEDDVSVQITANKLYENKYKNVDPADYSSFAFGRNVWEMPEETIFEGDQVFKDDNTLYGRDVKLTHGNALSNPLRHLSKSVITQYDTFKYSHSLAREFAKKEGLNILNSNPGVVRIRPLRASTSNAVMKAVELEDADPLEYFLSSTETGTAIDKFLSDFGMEAVNVDMAINHDDIISIATRMREGKVWNVP